MSHLHNSTITLGEYIDNLWKRHLFPFYSQYILYCNDEPTLLHKDKHIIHEFQFRHWIGITLVNHAQNGIFRACVPRCAAKRQDVAKSNVTSRLWPRMPAGCCAIDCCKRGYTRSILILTAFRRMKKFSRNGLLQLIRRLDSDGIF